MHAGLFSPSPPQFGIGRRQPNQDEAGLDRALHGANADVFASRHECERFAPQRPDGIQDFQRNIRKFVVGTRGKNLQPFGAIALRSQVRNANTSRVLKPTVDSGSYTWKFWPVAGKSFPDSGTDNCH